MAECNKKSMMITVIGYIAAMAVMVTLLTIPFIMVYLLKIVFGS